MHCTAGKDRAGIASAIIEEILGVSREDIVEDYLMTNTYLAHDIRMLTGLVKAHLKDVSDDEVDRALGYLFGAGREYIGAFYDEAEQRYGDFETFLRDGLECTGEDTDKIRTMYLV